MDVDVLPPAMRFLVASDRDEASLRQRDELRRLASWSSETPFAGRETDRLDDLVLVTIPELHLDRDYLERDLEATFGEPPELIVYLSKHRSESGRPSLTVHPIGNVKSADFGGQPRTLVPSAPRAMTAALRGLRRHARGLGYEVTFEATHHGPYVTVPTFFIEQGSTAVEWADADAARSIARVLLDLRKDDAPIALGLGGGHYVPRHTDLALTRRVAFGHLLPSYALDETTLDIIDQAAERTPGVSIAYLHRKSLPKPLVRACEERLESLDLRVVRERDLEGNPEDETS